MKRFGPYELVRQIAVGGMAELHLARTQGIAGFEKYIALKMIHPNFAADSHFVSMLIDEAKIAVQLQHANIGQTFDLGRVGDRYYITMEFIDGTDVYKMLRAASERNEDIPFDLAVYIAKELASGLDYAHRKKDREGRRLGIIHRDVSPQNVLVSYTGEVKIVDFGIAKAAVKLQQTAAGIIKGKYYYMSPEQAQGHAMDARSDIFSAGIVLYELIVGQMLYMDEQFDRLLQKVRTADIAPPSTIRRDTPRELDAIVMKALARAPSDRYQSAGEFAAELERYLHRSVPQFSTSFTAARLAQYVRDVMGDPEPVTIDQPLDLVGSQTLTLKANQFAHNRAEIQDENSMLFRLSQLKAPETPAREQPAPRPSQAPPLPQSQPTSAEPGRKHRITRPVVVEAPPEGSGPARPSVPPTLTARRASGESLIPALPLRPPVKGVPIAADIDATMVSDTAGLEDGRSDTTQSDRSDTTQSERPDTSLPRPDTTPMRGPAAQSRRLAEADPTTAPRQTQPPPPRDASLIARLSEDGPDMTMVDRWESAGGMDRTIVDDQPAPSPVNVSAALAANSPTAVVSELRPPRGSRDTPPPGSLLQNLVAIRGAAPMPAAPPDAPRPRDSLPPLVAPPSAPTMLPAAGNPAASPGAAPSPWAFPEAPDQRRSTLMVFGMVFAIALLVGVGITLLLLPSRDKPQGVLLIDSVPTGALAFVNGVQLPHPTPVPYAVKPGRYDVRVVLPRHEPHHETVLVTESSGEMPVTAILRGKRGKLVIKTKQDGVDIYINGERRGGAPGTIDLEMSSTTEVELRHPTLPKKIIPLEWPENGTLLLDVDLAK